MHYYWCMANYYSWIGKFLMKNGEYKDAFEHFKDAKIFFEKREDTKNVIYCEAHMYKCLALLKRSEKDYEDCSHLFFIASEKFRSINLILQSLQCEMNAWVCLGHHEMKNENYLKAKDHFKKASEIAKKIEDKDSENWNLAKHYKCLYKHIRKTKVGAKKLPDIIKLLEKKIVRHYEKTSDRIALIVSRADLNLKRSFLAKVNKNWNEAIKYSKEAEKLYKEASEIDKKDPEKHIRSAIYASAVALEIEALKSLYSKSYKTALEKFKEAMEKYEQSKSYDSYEVCKNLYEFCRGLLMVHETLLKLVHKFEYEHLAEQIEILFNDFIEALPIGYVDDTDKGYSFEARVRELINHFVMVVQK